MSLEGYYLFIYPTIDILAILTVVLAVRTLLSIRRQQKDVQTKKLLIRVFTLLSIGYLTWAMAEILWDVHSMFVKDLSYSFLADPFWVIGYFFVIGGFAYLSYDLYRSHGEIKKGIIMIILSLLITLILFFLIKTSIIPYIWDEGVWAGILGIYYPIASALAMISALTVFFLFREAKISTPLLLLTIALFCSFTGDMLFTYESWNELGYGVYGVVYDSFYALEYAFAALAFYLFSRKQ